MTSEVTTARRGRVLEIVLDRPPANAINKATTDALFEAFRTLAEDDGLRVGLITGAGEKIFSAGWDLKEVAAAASSTEVAEEALASPGGFAGITEYWDLTKPVICAVNAQ